MFLRSQTYKCTMVRDFSKTNMVSLFIYCYSLRWKRMKKKYDFAAWLECQMALCKRNFKSFLRVNSKLFAYDNYTIWWRGNFWRKLMEEYNLLWLTKLDNSSSSCSEVLSWTLWFISGIFELKSAGRDWIKLHILYLCLFHCHRLCLFNFLCLCCWCDRRRKMWSLSFHCLCLCHRLCLFNFHCLCFWCDRRREMWCLSFSLSFLF